MQIDKAQVKRILVITLSNVGDIMLTTPVIRALAGAFPAARIDVVVGPSGREVFERDPRIFKLMIYDKKASIAEKRRLQLKLKQLKYDLVADLRNTVFGLLIGPKFRTSTIGRFPPAVVHAGRRHLYRLHSLGIETGDARSYIHIPGDDDKYASGLLKELGITDPVVCVNPGAKSHLKRWTAEGFAKVSDRLMEKCRANIVFIGLKEDEETVSNVVKLMKNKPHTIVGRTNLRQLAAFLKMSRLLITNDSAPLHLACAVGTKVLAVFGPTDPRKYGPTGEFDSVVNRKLSCSPCEKAECAHNYECMKLVSPDDVFEAARMMVEGYE
jgi:ADP-heptose:LPS heptosyltransferase